MKLIDLIVYLWNFKGEQLVFFQDGGYHYPVDMVKTVQVSDLHIERDDRWCVHGLKPTDRVLVIR